MKFVNLHKQEVKQFYVIPTTVIQKSYIRTRVFIVWLIWSIEL